MRFHYAIYRIEPQVIRLLPQSRALEPFVEQRGSIEETQRILREIERINIAMGYRKKQEVAFPRTKNFNEGYFYPRPVYQPLNFRTTTSPAVPMLKQIAAIAEPQPLLSTPNPFNTQVYYYPAPYLRVPMPDAPRLFQARQLPAVKKTKGFSPQIFVLPIAVPSADGRSSEVRYIPSTIDFGSFQPLKSRGKSLQVESPEKKVKKAKGVVEDMAVVVEDDKVDEDILEEMFDAVDFDDDDDDEKKEVLSTTDKISNDKFINSRLTSSEESDEIDPDLELMVLNKSVRGKGRSFNITATFQNFTNRFIPSSSPPTTVPSEIKQLQDLSDASEGAIVEASQELEQEKGPFGLFNNRQTTPENGGIVIQRLRVRHGGIAIAGPGGVATAGSGGTAIVGPNGTAITHPRSLTIAGPGAKIYAVPESVDLGKTINATQRSLPLDAVLVANGPVVFYRN